MARAWEKRLFASGPDQLFKKLLEVRNARPEEIPAVIFTCDGEIRKNGIVERLVGHSGWLQYGSFQNPLASNEYKSSNFICGLVDDGETLGADACSCLFSMPAVVEEASGKVLDQKIIAELLACAKNSIENEFACYLGAETEEIDNWAADLNDELESDLKDLEEKISVAKREARFEADAREKSVLQFWIASTEEKRDKKRMEILEAADAIKRRYDELLLRSGKYDDHTGRAFFTIYWEMAKA